MDDNNNMGFYTQEHATIYGHGVWHYLISTPIGDIHIVEWEGKGMGLERKLFDCDNSAAEKEFQKVAANMLKGRYL